MSRSWRCLLLANNYLMRLECGSGAKASKTFWEKDRDNSIENTKEETNEVRNTTWYSRGERKEDQESCEAIWPSYLEGKANPPIPYTIQTISFSLYLPSFFQFALLFVLMEVNSSVTENHFDHNHHSSHSYSNHHHGSFPSKLALIIIISIVSVMVILAITLIILLLRRLKSAKTSGSHIDDEKGSLNNTSCRFIVQNSMNFGCSPGNNHNHVLMFLFSWAFIMKSKFFVCLKLMLQMWRAGVFKEGTWEGQWGHQGQSQHQLDTEEFKCCHTRNSRRPPISLARQMWWAVEGLEWCIGEFFVMEPWQPLRCCTGKEGKGSVLSGLRLVTSFIISFVFLICYLSIPHSLLNVVSVLFSLLSWNHWLKKSNYPFVRTICKHLHFSTQYWSMIRRYLGLNYNMLTICLPCIFQKML